jgi:hypothetical protein
MRKLLLIPVLFLLLSLVAIAQDSNDLTPIPADKIAAAAKPFLGKTFDGINCTGGDGVVGLRFTFAQSAPTKAPVATLLQFKYQDATETQNEVFDTVDFTYSVSEDGSVDDFLVITNGKVLAMLSPYKPGAIFGVAFTKTDPTPHPIVLLTSTGSLDDFVKANAALCTSQEARKKLIEELK